MALEGQSPHTDKSPATSKINFVSCYILTFFVHSLGRARSSIFMQVFSTCIKGPLLSSTEGHYSPVNLGTLAELFTVPCNMWKGGKI